MNRWRRPFTVDGATAERKHEGKTSDDDSRETRMTLHFDLNAIFEFIAVDEVKFFRCRLHSSIRASRSMSGHELV